MKILYIVLLPISIMLSCNATKKADKTNTNDVKDSTEIVEPVTDKEAIQPQEFEIILQESYGGLDASEERVIRNESELQEVYGIINRFRRPGIPAPNINFEKEMVIALFMGEKRTGGFSSEIKSIDNSGEKAVLLFEEKGPNPEVMVATAICQPFCFVKVPITKKEVVFKKLN